jgi:4-amino-4-deoxychorismate lyase
MKASLPSLDWDISDNFDVDLPRGVYKLRIVYDSKEKTFEITPYKIRPLRSLKLVFDNDIVYDRKYEDRTELERLWAQRADCDDVLIIKNNLVTDISYANIIFRKENSWYTPDSFLLNGVMRQRLLDLGRITERRITVDNIREFTHFRPINAMLREDAPESEVSNIR